MKPVGFQRISAQPCSDILDAALVIVLRNSCKPVYQEKQFAHLN